MNHDTMLFDFLCTLIDIQIKKYVSLASIGVGPDARLNAQLVCDEVNELLEFANQLLKQMEINTTTAPIDRAYYIPIFNQVKFYVEQEHVRAYAGWLLDENNIHTPVMHRVKEQLEQLHQIAKIAKIGSSVASKPVTAIQKKCEYDSCAIAFYILDLAKKIKATPKMELDKKIPTHAQIILRRNATTRYCNVEFAQDIETLHTQHNIFLTHSDLEKSSSRLTKELAKSQEIIHRKQWNTILNRYKNLYPTAKLFAPEHDWYKVSANSSSKNKSSVTSSNLRLFRGAVILGGVFIYMLLSYFTQTQENSLELEPKNNLS